LHTRDLLAYYHAITLAALTDAIPDVQNVIVCTL
jgi:hypothetical protein